MIQFLFVSKKKKIFRKLFLKTHLLKNFVLTKCVKKKKKKQVKPNISVQLFTQHEANLNYLNLNLIHIINLLKFTMQIN